MSTQYILEGLTGELEKYNTKRVQPTAETEIPNVFVVRLEDGSQEGDGDGFLNNIPRDNLVKILVVGDNVRAKWAFASVAPGQLDLEKGDVVKITAIPEGGDWFMVKKGEQIGHVPQTYVVPQEKLSVLRNIRTEKTAEMTDAVTASPADARADYTEADDPNRFDLVGARLLRAKMAAASSELLGDHRSSLLVDNAAAAATHTYRRGFVPRAQVPGPESIKRQSTTEAKLQQVYTPRSPGNLSDMTIPQLRKIAEDIGVRLSAGITSSRHLISLIEEKEQEEEEKEQEEEEDFGFADIETMTADELIKHAQEIGVKNASDVLSAKILTEDAEKAIVSVDGISERFIVDKQTGAVYSSEDGEKEVGIWSANDASIMIDTTKDDLIALIQDEDIVDQRRREARRWRSSGAAQARRDHLLEREQAASVITADGSRVAQAIAAATLKRRLTNLDNAHRDAIGLVDEAIAAIDQTQQQWDDDEEYSAADKAVADARQARHTHSLQSDLDLGDPVAEVYTDTELRKMSVRQLRQMAEQNGVSREEAAVARDGDNPKHDLIKLIRRGEQLRAAAALGSSETIRDGLDEQYEILKTTRVRNTTPIKGKAGMVLSSYDEGTIIDVVKEMRDAEGNVFLETTTNPFVGKMMMWRGRDKENTWSAEGKTGWVRFKKGKKGKTDNMKRVTA